MTNCTQKEIATIKQFTKHVRKKLKLNQTQFAQLIEVSQSQVAKYENGRAMPPACIYLRIMSVDPDRKK